MNLKKIKDRINGSVIFLVLVILVYLIVLIFNREVFFESLYGSYDLFLKIIFILIGVFVFMFVLNIFLTPERALKYLGKGSGLKGWIISIFGGILSTGPIYLWYPLLKDLKEKGMKNSLVATFLYNRAIKIPLMPMMIFYFGIKFFILLTFFMIIFSIFNGLIVEKLMEVF